ncbi:MAG: protein kinase [Anaerolineales bacterium]|nr:protein kinase [Anaerolineales bacterium]
MISISKQPALYGDGVYRGQNLKEYLYDLRATERTLSWDEVIRIAARVADALDYAHLRQMIHRDIKPANIMLGNDGGVFLSDFGLVRLLDQPGLTNGPIDRDNGLWPRSKCAVTANWLTIGPIFILLAAFCMK